MDVGPGARAPDTEIRAARRGYEQKPLPSGPVKASRTLPPSRWEGGPVLALSWEPGFERALSCSPISHRPLDASAQRWLSYRPGVPDFVNSLSTLQRLDGLFIYNSGSRPVMISVAER